MVDTFLQSASPFQWNHHRDLKTIGCLRDKIVIEVPLTLLKSTIVRQINKILKTAYEGREVVSREENTAKRKLAKSKLRKETLDKMLVAYEIKQKKPNLMLRQLDEHARIGINLMARSWL
jgi:hypothetical protein